MFSLTEGKRVAYVALATEGVRGVRGCHSLECHHCQRGSGGRSPGRYASAASGYAHRASDPAPNFSRHTAPSWPPALHGLLRLIAVMWSCHRSRVHVGNGLSMELIHMQWGGEERPLACRHLAEASRVPMERIHRAQRSRGRACQTPDVGEGEWLHARRFYVLLGCWRGPARDAAMAALCGVPLE